MPEVLFDFASRGDCAGFAKEIATISLAMAGVMGLIAAILWQFQKARPYFWVFSSMAAVVIVVGPVSALVDEEVWHAEVTDTELSLKICKGLSLQSLSVARADITAIRHFNGWQGRAKHRPEFLELKLRDGRVVTMRLHQSAETNIPALIRFAPRDAMVAWAASLAEQKIALDANLQRLLAGG